jgi:indole-3-acetate monooxygenase
MTDVTHTPALAAIAARAGERSAEIEQLRRLPDDLVEDLVDTGVFRLWVAGRYGGAEAHVTDLLDAIEATAYHDGSTGWCVAIGGSTALLSGLLDPHWAQVIFGDPRTVAGGFGMPAGMAVATEGGLRVTGRWSWGSGTDHCNWIGGGVRIVDADGQPAALADGTRSPFVFFDRADVELLDTWYAAGLRGTASTDYQVHDALVPTGRWVEFVGGRPPVVDSPLYRFSFLGALALGVASVTIGLARRAIDELAALGAKRPMGSSRTLAERAPAQAELARAEAAVRSARSFVREAVDQAWTVAADEGAMTDELKGLIRLAATDAAVRCAEAVDRCYHTGGGTSVYEISPLQRVFRDVHTATQHGMIAPRTLEPLGRMGFGLPTDARQL